MSYIPSWKDIPMNEAVKKLPDIIRDFEKIQKDLSKEVSVMDKDMYNVNSFKTDIDSVVGSVEKIIKKLKSGDYNYQD